MWIVFSLLCMVILTTADIVGKKAVSADDLAPIKLSISAVTASFAAGIILYVLGLGESGLAPWTLLIEHPMIMVSLVYLVFSEFLYIFSMKYIGMSIMEAVSSFEGIAIFLGMLIVNVVTGRLAEIREMLTTGRFIMIAIVMVFTLLLSNIECKTIDEKERPNIRGGKRSLPVGIAIAMLGVVFGSLDSIIGDSILNSGKIGAVDFTMTIFFASIILMPIFVAVLVVKQTEETGRVHSYRFTILYGILFALQVFCGITAAYFDAVRSEVMYLCYPVIAILGAKLVLKEHYSRRQELYIWVITLAAVTFCTY